MSSGFARVAALVSLEFVVAIVIIVIIHADNQPLVLYPLRVYLLLEQSADSASSRRYIMRIVMQKGKNKKERNYSCAYASFFLTLRATDTSELCQGERFMQMYRARSLASL